MLDAVAHAYGHAGIGLVRVTAAQALPDGDLDPGTAVLVDDAHRLDAPSLDRLHAFAETDGARLVLAYRPWPASRPLSILKARAARQGITVVVGHLDRGAVAARMAERLGCAPPDALVDLVHEQSGGLPALVNIVTQALLDVGRFDPGRPDQFRRPDRVTISIALAERLRHHVEGLEPDVHCLLEAMAIGASLETEVLAPLVGVRDLSTTVEAARASGLLTESGALIPFVRNLLLRLTPVLRIREMQRQLAGIQLDRGGSVLEAGRQMLGTGASGSRVATIFEAAGDEAMRQSADLATNLFTAAVEAGGSSSTMAARRARAAMLTGDLDQALRLADEVISRADGPDREQGIAVAAAALAHRGLLARSADLYRCLPPSAAVLSVPALIGTGELDDACKVLDAAADDAAGPSSLLDGAGMMLARGMLASITGSAPAALSQLARAGVLLEPVAATVLLPDTPAALAALVALQCGELDVADAALRRAVAGKQGGRPAHPRHLLLHGWLALLRGQLDNARRAVQYAQPPGQALEPRDELLAAALAVGLERRIGDTAALAAAWSRARTALVHHPVDLYALLPLGELAVAAAGLGEREWIASPLDDAWRLLDELDMPALWAAPLHWYEVQAAIGAEQRPEAQRHAAALADLAEAGPCAAVLAAAATGWLQVQWGEIDPDAVQAAARRLHGLGLRWEAAYLAGRAAARATDRRAVTVLHACARSLFSGSVGADAPALAEIEPGAGVSGQPDADPAPAVAAVPVERATSDVENARPPAALEGEALSDRELDIGRLILAGLTYKQIGQRLYISAKTVEHHVARMRQRLDVASRNELFGRLRVLLDEPAAEGQ